MSVGGYPIKKLAYDVHSFANQKYSIWYWHLGGSALEAPIEPLTQEFWQEKRDSRLAYGLHLPGIHIRFGGDLLILVTQRLMYANSREFDNLTHSQKYELQRLILMADFIHIEDVKRQDAPRKTQYFKKCEQSFIDEILPKRNANGDYYRDTGIHPEELFTLNLTEEGKTSCPSCQQIISFDDGLWATNKQETDDGRILIHAFCQYCHEHIEIYTDNIPNIYKSILT